MLARTLIGAAVLGLLADAAPSCGPRPHPPIPQLAQLSVRGPACTCVSEPVEVIVDSRTIIGTVACDAVAVFHLLPGKHMVAGGRGGFSWKQYEATLTEGGTTNIQIECPAADAK